MLSSGRSLNVVPLVAILVALFLVGSARAAGVREIDAAALQRLLRDEPAKVFLLDVRTPGEFAAGRLAGAVLIPMNQVPNRLAEIPREKKVVTVCATGARSAAVARYLVDRGYPWVANYVGGVMDWGQRGLPLVR